MRVLTLGELVCNFLTMLTLVVKENMAEKKKNKFRGNIFFSPRTEEIGATSGVIVPWPLSLPCFYLALEDR